MQRGYIYAEILQVKTTPFYHFQSLYTSMIIRDIRGGNNGLFLCCLQDPSHHRYHRRRPFLNRYMMSLFPSFDVYYANYFSCKIQLPSQCKLCGVRAQEKRRRRYANTNTNSHAPST